MAWVVGQGVTGSALVLRLKLRISLHRFSWIIWPWKLVSVTIFWTFSPILDGCRALSFSQESLTSYLQLTVSLKRQQELESQELPSFADRSPIIMLSSLPSENAERVNILSSRSLKWSSQWKDWRRKEISTLVSLKESKYSQSSFIIQTILTPLSLLLPRQTKRCWSDVSRKWGRGRRNHQKGHWPFSFSNWFNINRIYRFWTSFIRQKMALLFLKRRTAPHLQRGKKNTSVPWTWMLLDLSYR